MGSPRLSERDIETAVQILDSWTGKLTWERYIDELALSLRHKYTKPGLRKQARILTAWEMTKQRLRDAQEAAGMRPGETPDMTHARRRIEQLKAQIARLERENQDLLERFRRWSHNAVIRGVSEQQLDQDVIGNQRKTE